MDGRKNNRNLNDESSNDVITKGENLSVSLAMISAMEVKHSLRKMDFPLSAQFALSKIEELLTSSQGRARNFFMVDLALELISEFVFNEVDWRGEKKKNKMTFMQEFQLIYIISEFLTLPGVDEARKNAVFLLLFNYNDQDKQDRSRLLEKLASLAVSLKNSHVLKSIAIQMQQLGSISKFALDLTQTLINDFFVILPHTVNKFTELPKVCPLFTANLLTAVTQLYFNPGEKYIIIPPKELLRVIAKWIINDVKLCRIALVHDLKPSLPIGAIPMPAISPYAGLFKWTILGTLYEANMECRELYLRMHFTIINSMSENNWTNKELNIISVQSLINIIAVIKRKCNSQKRKPVKNPEEEEKIQQSINWLSTAFLFAHKKNLIYGNLQDFVANCKTLPHNMLMNMVLKHNNLIR